MKKIKCILILIHAVTCLQAQVLNISYNQNGYVLQGKANMSTNAYALIAPNGDVCGFTASFEYVNDNILKMSVYNPTLYGYIPATYYPYENGTCEVYVQEGCVGKGQWSAERGEVSFKGKCCNGTVGCSCTGFVPITDGYEWQKEYCKKCGHKRSEHKCK